MKISQLWVGPDQERALEGVHAAAQTALPLEPYNPADLVGDASVEKDVV